MKMDLPERTEVRVIIRGSFSKLIEELGEIEAKEDINGVLGRMRNRNYKGVLDASPSLNMWNCVMRRYGNQITHY